MSDPLERPGDRMFTAAAEYGRTHWGWDQEPVPDPVPTEEESLAEIAKQLRVANMIAFGQATGESYRAEIRKALGLS